MYKKPCDVLYHVFSNGCDDWLPTLKEAVKLARKWAREFGCVRIYKETEWNAEDGIFEDGECILSHGKYPL